jgi:kumamolisin
LFRLSAVVLAIVFLTLASAAPIPPSASNGAKPHSIPPGRIIRKTLTKAEQDTLQKAHFALRLQNFAELRSRIEKGEVISLKEMQARYLPTKEQWHKVAAWAIAHGYVVGAPDDTRMTVFATGTVAQTEKALHAKFARIMGTDGKEYTSAVGAPLLPDEIASLVTGVLQLQPHLKPISRQITAPIQITPNGGISPMAIRQLYNADGLGWDGTGETIVILGASVPDPNDLVTFWNKCGLPTTLSQFSVFDPLGRTQAQIDPFDYNRSENTKDIEWASAMAPGAKIILYDGIDPEAVCAWVLGQLPTNPSIHQISVSYGLPEILLNTGAPDAATQSASHEASSQYFAVLAGVGVSVFACSGDFGSNDLINYGYSPSAPAFPEYPASDPFVTGVGGTNVLFTNTGLQLNPPGGISVAKAALPVQEGGWTLVNLVLSDGTVEYGAFSVGASGGGISPTFDRPSWQTGPGVPAGTKRCVPDVSAMSTGMNFYAYSYFKGQDDNFAGTSLSSPLWSGVCALLNQARAHSGQSPLGLLGPHIYPLIGTAAFNDMVAGEKTNPDLNAPYDNTLGFSLWSTDATNGAYTVTPGYDLVTGIGTPNVGNLIQALTVGETSMVAPYNAIITITVP